MKKETKKLQKLTKKAHKEGNKDAPNTMCEFISSLPKLGKKGMQKGPKKNF